MHGIWGIKGWGYWGIKYVVLIIMGYWGIGVLGIGGYWGIGVVEKKGSREEIRRKEGRNGMERKKQD